MIKTKIIYNSSIPATVELAEQYHACKNTNWRYLAYRDLNGLFKKHVVGNVALDYGSGTGISAEFLHNHGFKVTGVDINPDMLKSAKKNTQNINFERINSNDIFVENTYDLIFSSFVLEEIPTIEKIISYLKVANIALKDNGVFVAVTGNLTITRNNFLTVLATSDRSTLKSGDMCTTYMHELNIEFKDYYWTLTDFKYAFAESKFAIAEIHFPLGKKEENIPWRDELYESPYVILVAKVSR
jgi:SAM-dependent methyltransferase